MTSYGPVATPQNQHSIQLGTDHFHTQFQSNQQQLEGRLHPATLEAAGLIFK